ncbi:Type II secretion system protein E [compost metagenome]
MTSSAWWSPELLTEASSISLERKEPILRVLQEVAGCGTDELLSAIKEYTGWHHLSLQEVELMEPNFDALNYVECLRRDSLLLSDASGERWLVTGNPIDPDLSSWASCHFSGYFRIGFLLPEEIKKLFGRFESQSQVLTNLSVEETDQINHGRMEDISPASIARNESEVIRLVNSTLYEAHRQGASDIHCETASHGLVVRYRIDGVLSPARTVGDRVMPNEIISRIKVMAELDIGEKRIPQDGRFSVTINGREIDFRVSVMPSMFGEDIVLRILDKQSLTSEIAQLNLGLLGLDTETCQMMRRLASQPYGMLLVTGPTGSGKTTTLYATLSEVNSAQDKTITIEDPVEYQLPGVLQIPVNEKKGLTFARGLRSILRHDPDRILVGEIRDRETAEIAVQAALTGHLVYTTVHANSVFDVLSRFRHMGIDTYSFVTALNGIVAQRLVRLVCPHCRESVTPESALLHASGLQSAVVRGWEFMQGRGCAHCRGTGYKGRRALAEVLILDDELRELIVQQASISRLKELARNQGMRSIRDQALQAVRDGQTSLEEINRVTFVD